MCLILLCRSGTYTFVPHGVAIPPPLPQGFAIHFSFGRPRSLLLPFFNNNDVCVTRSLPFVSFPCTFSRVSCDFYLFTLGRHRCRPNRTGPYTSVPGDLQRAHHELPTGPGGGGGALLDCPGLFAHRRPGLLHGGACVNVDGRTETAAVDSCVTVFCGGFQYIFVVEVDVLYATP